jgi:hypothetical protein
MAPLDNDAHAPELSSSSQNPTCIVVAQDSLGRALRSRGSFLRYYHSSQHERTGGILHSAKRVGTVVPKGKMWSWCGLKADGDANNRASARVRRYEDMPLHQEHLTLFFSVFMIVHDCSCNEGGVLLETIVCNASYEQYYILIIKWLMFLDHIMGSSALLWSREFSISFISRPPRFLHLRLAAMD